MLTFLLFLAIIFLFYRISNLDTQLKNLQKYLEQLQLTKSFNQSLPELTTSDPRLTQRIPTEPQTPPNPSKKTIEQLAQARAHEFKNNNQNIDLSTRFVQWFQIDWPLKVGAIFIILAIAWFVTYAFLNNWIGPYGRITLGLIAGTSIMLFAHRWFNKSHHQGLTLELLGASLNLITIFAAQNVYQMFPTPLALLFSIIIMFFLAYSSLTYKDRWLALSGLIVGALAPILTGTSEPNIVGLYLYLITLCIGTLWLAKDKNWNFLIPTALGIVTFYSLPYFNHYTIKNALPIEIIQLRTFAIAFTTLFFLSNIHSLIAQKRPAFSHILTALSLGLFALTWINTLTPEHLKSLIALTTAIIFASAASLIHRHTQNPAPVYIYTGTATLLLTVATAYQFDGPSLIVAFSALATILPILYTRILGPKFGLALLLYFLIPILLSLPSFFSSSWKHTSYQQVIAQRKYTQLQAIAPKTAVDRIFHNDFIAILTLNAGLWLAGLHFYTNRQQIKSQLKESIHVAPSQFHTATNAMLIIASIYTLALIWKVTHAGFDTQYIARFLTLTIYTLIGLLTYFQGQYLQRPVLYKYGMYLTLTVIGWLIIVEVWSMPLAGRIITFLTLGILLIASVLIRKKPTISHLS